MFKGARVLDPTSGTDAVLDVLVNGDRIEQVGANIASKGAEVIDVAGAVLSPGFVDMHVHLREPGREDEETVATGTAGAALGGFTAVCAMPNTDPVCDSAAVAEMVAAQGRLFGLAHVVPAGSLTKGLEGKFLSPIGEMVHSSAAVRVFTDDGKGVQDARLLRRAMEYIKGFDAICAEHCEDASLAEGGQMNEGEISDLLGLKGIPSEAEEVALARDLALAKLTGVRFHALHISTAGCAELIRRAKAEGVRVTAEVTPHHLTLVDSELMTYDTNFKVNPPLRSAADVEALRVALADGTIDAIATDHAPHSPEEKESEFESAPPGMLGLETALGVCITGLVEPGVLTLLDLIRVMSTSPARILGLDRHGGPIVAGAPANLVVFDPAKRWTVDAFAMASPSHNSPWEGKPLRGKVLHTLFEGRLVVRDGSVLSSVHS
ncbi:MAG: dihydroorotase [Actinomycetota bacterium]